MILYLGRTAGVAWCNGATLSTFGPHYKFARLGTFLSFSCPFGKSVLFVRTITYLSFCISLSIDLAVPFHFGDLDIVDLFNEGRL